MYKLTDLQKEANNPYLLRQTDEWEDDWVNQTDGTSLMYKLMNLGP